MYGQTVFGPDVALYFGRHEHLSCEDGDRERPTNLNWQHQKLQGNQTQYY